MALATLSIDLEARLAALQQGLDKAGRLAEQQAARIEGAFTGLKAAAVGVAGALTAALSVPVAFGFIKSTVDGIDALNDLADATGASIENLSALEDIAARTGTSVETAGDAVIKLNKVLGEARADNDAGRAIKAIGLSAEELRRLDPAEALRVVSVALAGYQDDANKARLVQELFGKSAKEVAPLLKDLAEAGQLNATVTTEQAQQAEKLNKQIAAFQKNVLDLARDITGALLPALNRFLEGIKALSGLGEVGFSGVLGEVLKGNTFRDASQGVEFYANKLRDLQKQREIIAADGNPIARRGGLVDIDAEIGKVTKLQAFYKTLAGTAGEVRDAWGREAARGGMKGVLPALLGGDKANKPKEVEPIVVKLDDTTQAALKRLQELDTNKIAALRLELQALIELRAEQGGGSVDEAILQVEEALAKLDPAQQEAVRNQQRLNELLANTPSGRLEKVRGDVELLNAAFAAGKISVEQWAEGVRASTESLGEGGPFVELSEFAQQAARNIQDALGQSIEDAFSGNARNIEDIWKNMLKRLAAQAAAAQIGRWLLGDSFGKTGQMGGAVGDFFSWLSGLGGGARASGGPVYAGRPYLVGERGPEVVVPSGNGTVLPNGVMPAAAAAPAAVYNINVQGDASANTVRLINAALAQYEARRMRMSGA